MSPRCTGSLRSYSGNDEGNRVVSGIKKGMRFRWEGRGGSESSRGRNKCDRGDFESYRGDRDKGDSDGLGSFSEVDMRCLQEVQRVNEVVEDLGV